MIDKLFCIGIVLNATGLFRFVAPQVGVSIGQVSLVLLALNIAYLLIKLRYALPMLLQSTIPIWLLFLVMWPFFTVIYSPVLELREIGLLFFYFSLLFGTAVYTVSNGIHAIHRVFTYSLAVGLVGLALSMIMPGYFETVQVLTNAKSDVAGRAFGFSMQPNSLALTMAYLFIGWYATWQDRKALPEIGAILALFLVMLLTGSRVGMLVAVLLVGLILTHAWKHNLTNKRYVLKLCMLGVGLLVGILVLRFVLSVIDENRYRREADIVDRMQNLLSFKLSSDGEVIEDASVQQRFIAQKIYLQLIAEKPILGHGFGSDTFYQETGRKYLSAHSEALTCAMQYGVLYPLVFVLLLYKLYRSSRNRKVDAIFHSNSVKQFVVLTVFVFTIGSLFDERVFYVELGVFFAVAYSAKYQVGHRSVNMIAEVSEPLVELPAGPGSTDKNTLGLSS